jgi:hypothetical protein
MYFAVEKKKIKKNKKLSEDKYNSVLFSKDKLSINIQEYIYAFSLFREIDVFRSCFTEYYVKMAIMNPLYNVMNYTLVDPLYNVMNYTLVDPLYNVMNYTLVDDHFTT